MCCRRRDRRQADVHWTSAFEGFDSQFLNLTKKKRHPKGWRSFWQMTLIRIQRLLALARNEPPNAKGVHFCYRGFKK